MMNAFKPCCLTGRCFMKGPYQRLKWDLRRLWECPVCKRQDRTAGTVTFRHCPCQMQKLDGQPVVMKLVEDEPPHFRPLVPHHHAPLAANASDPALVSDIDDQQSSEQPSSSTGQPEQRT